MTRAQRLVLVLLRLALGGIFLYSGLTGILSNSLAIPHPLVSALLPDFYHWVGSPARLMLVNTIYEWSLLVVGLLILTGFLTYFASIAGIILILFTYLPTFSGSLEHALNADLIYILVFVLLIVSRAGSVFGLDRYFRFVFLRHGR